MPGNFSRFFKNSFPRDDDDAAVGMASAEKRRSRWESDSPFSLPSFYVFASTFCEQKRRDRSVPSLVVFSYFHASLERVNRMPPDGLLDLFQQRYFLFFFFFFFFFFLPIDFRFSPLLLFDEPGEGRPSFNSNCPL